VPRRARDRVIPDGDIGAGTDAALARVHCSITPSANRIGNRVATPGAPIRPAADDQNVRITSVPMVNAPESLNVATPVVALVVLLNTRLPPND
jgi:hypothetical protein